LKLFHLVVEAVNGDLVIFSDLLNERGCGGANQTEFVTHTAAHINEYGCGKRRFFGGKRIDRLRRAVFRQSEIFGLQAVRVFARFIGDGDADDDQIGIQTQRFVLLRFLFVF
jgi:hypothetical protein